MEMPFAGKYTQGQTTDPKTWKANFRCALNSLPDIEEVKDKSINKGHQAKRVFRMLPVTPKSRGETSDRAFPVAQEASSALCTLSTFYSSKRLSVFSSDKRNKAKELKARRKVNRANCLTPSVMATEVL